MLLHWVLCGFVAIAVIHVGSLTNCPDKCSCEGKFVQCKGDAIANITARIPSDTLYYTYTAMETSVDLGSVNFMHLSRLRNLTINTTFDDFVFDRTLNFSASMQYVFRPLRNLRSLKISISWNMSEPMPEMFSYLNNLELLDLSYTQLINYTSLQQSLKGLKDNHVLQKVVLKNTQTFQYLINGMSFNLSYFLEPIAHCPLRHLDLSYNSLKNIYPGLIRFAPILTEIIVANNLFVLFFTNVFFIEILLHPRLETADCSQQGRGVNPQNYPQLPTGPQILSIGPHETTKVKIPHDESLMLKTSTRGFQGLKTHHNEFQILNSFETGNNIKTLPQIPVDLMRNENFSLTDTDCASNLCNILKPECKVIMEFLRYSHQAFCDALYKKDEMFRGIPCTYIPPIDDLLNKDCSNCLVYPSTGNLQRLILSDYSNYDRLKIRTQYLSKTKCFYPNKIKFMDFSNIYPLGYLNFDALLQTPITGLNDLKEVKLSGCGLKQPYLNLSLSFPSLTHLDLSKNKLTLKEHHGKFLTGPPTVVYINLAQNLIQTIPEKTLSTMQVLEELNLAQNYFMEPSMNLTHLPRLRNISFANNEIKSFSRNMMEQFNEHAQKANYTIHIDLRDNPLLCTCNERDFVRWIQDAKSHNLYFTGIETIQCINGESNKQKILDVDLDNMTICCLSATVYISISICAAVVLAATIVGFGMALYRKRWWFRYKYFLVTKMYKQRQELREAQRNYEYDAFVSYNSRDELWITEELQPKLEDEFGLKLCLHQRDFVLGGDIMEQITSGIENSRKTLLILSPNFLASTWCHWEMNLAHSRLGNTGQDVLMLAILSRMSKVGFPVLFIHTIPIFFRLKYHILKNPKEKISYMR